MVVDVRVTAPVHPVLAVGLVGLPKLIDHEAFRWRHGHHRGRKHLLGWVHG